MRTDNLAQGLASLGRNGDSMLVHMNPEEVLGLQNLAIQNGTSLTINPDTGMPEAFSLGGVMKSLLPTIGGAALTGLTGGAISPLTAGLLLGGATTIFTGDPLQGIMAGFGGYGGGQLAKSISNFGMSQAAGLSDDAASFGSEALAKTGTGMDAGFASQLDPTDIMGVGAQKGSFGVDLAAAGADDVIGAGQTFGRDVLANTQTFPLQDGIRGVQGLGTQPGVGVNLAGTTAVQTPTLPTVPQPVGAVPTGTQAFKQGLSAVTADPLAFAKQNAADLALTGGGALLAGVEESDIYPNMNEPLYVDPDTGMYRSPTGGLQLYGPNTRSLNLNDPYGYLKTAKTGGQIKKYQQGGITSLTQSQDAHRQDVGYGMSRLDDMAKQAAMSRASTMGYAAGGMTTAEMNNFGNVMQNVPTTVGNMPVSPTGAIKGLQEQMDGQTPNIDMPKSLDNVANAAQADDEMSTGLASIKVISAETPEMTLSLTPETKQMAEGGIAGLEDGRMLNGNGDGVSDDIPAMIEEEQPAALSDGEFVVPARIVSELGNGSSDAGAKKLYAMIDRIQAARKQTMGSKKQYAKDTNAERYLPA